MGVVLTTNSTPIIKFLVFYILHGLHQYQQSMSLPFLWKLVHWNLFFHTFAKFSAIKLGSYPCENRWVVSASIIALAYDFKYSKTLSDSLKSPILWNFAHLAYVA